MPIVIVSADVPEIEQQIAEMTAESLGYRIVGPDILKKVAEKYDVPEAKLSETLTQRPSLTRGLPTKKWEFLLSCIEQEILEALNTEGTLCWGTAAHLYVRGVAHALKVRIISDPEKRVRSIAETHGIDLKRAQRILAKKQGLREQWSRAAYDRNELNPANYDLVINLSQISPEEAVATITTTIGYRKFVTTTYSRNCMKDLTLESRVRHRLIPEIRDIKVMARDGKVVVNTMGLKREMRKKTETIKALAGTVKGVTYVEVQVNLDIFSEAMQSMR
ncbi:MAG: cytidylate kinase family protein [Desulfobacterales bacterium]|nr:cytidylate kinase family protein [Desulfobacterales bacterium]